VPLSAEHGEGLAGLYEAIGAALAAREAGVPRSDGASAGDVQPPDADETEDDPARPITLAIVGRPNAGKSTLLNRLLGEERVITGPEPGLTRDAITIPWSYKKRPFRLVDTAGLRRRARVDSDLEKLSASDTERAIRYADVVVLMVDATTIGEFGAGIEKQDLTIAREVEAEGRALVVAVNKWDLIDDPARKRAAVEESLEESLSQLRGVPIVFVSALEGTYLDRMLDLVVDVEARWSRRISTSPLNRWLAGAVEAHTPPLVNGRYVKLRYMTQIKARPPSFVIFVSRPDALPDSYVRYLTNGLRVAFGFDGVPLRLSLRKGKNPYAP
jgi:GTP-binding protein